MVAGHYMRIILQQQAFQYGSTTTIKANSTKICGPKMAWENGCDMSP
jgi:hypothetical protein